MKRLNGGELLIDFTKFGSFDNGTTFDEMGVTQKDLEPINDILVKNKSGVIDLKKPILFKIIMQEYLLAFRDYYISDDYTGFHLTFIRNEFSYDVNFVIDESGVIAPETCSISHLELAVA